MQLTKILNSKSIFKILFFIILAASCDTPKEISSTSTETSREAYVRYEIQAHGQVQPIYDIINTAELLLLEQTEDTDLPYIRFFDTWGKNIVLSSFGYGNIHLFDSEGDLIRNFQRMGDSDDKYSALWYFWLDGQEIAVYDATNRRINYYNSEAEFVKTVPIDYPTTGLYSFKDYLFFDTSDRLYNGTDSVNIVVLDSRLEYQFGLLPYINPEPIRTNWGPNSFEPYDESILYQDPINNTMYQWSQKSQSFDSLFTIDLGEDWVWNNQEYYGNKVIAKQVQKSGEKIIRMKNTVGKNYLFLRFEQFGSFHSILIDRKNGKHQKLSSNQGILEDRTFVPLKWIGDSLVFTIESDKIENFVKALPENTFSFKSEKTDIHANKSSSLFWLTFQSSDFWK